MPDRAPTLSSCFSFWCLCAFMPAAVAGAVFALSAPVALVRVLGIVALAGGLLGLLLHSLLLRRDHPAAWAALHVRGRACAKILRSRLGLWPVLPTSAAAKGD